MCYYKWRYAEQVLTHIFSFFPHSVLIFTPIIHNIDIIRLIYSILPHSEGTFCIHSPYIILTVLLDVGTCRIADHHACSKVLLL